MAPKIRTIKPEYFKHELLCELETNFPDCKIMLFFAGLWCHCDANGVFRYRPKLLANEILPFVDYPIYRTLEILIENNFIRRFQSKGKDFAIVINFSKHQRPGNYERRACEAPSEYLLKDAGLEPTILEIIAAVEKPSEQTSIIPVVDAYDQILEQLTGDIYVEQTCINNGFDKEKFLRFIRKWVAQKKINGSLRDYPAKKFKDFVITDYQKDLKLNAPTNGKQVIKQRGEYVAP